MAKTTRKTKAARTSVSNRRVKRDPKTGHYAKGTRGGPGNPRVTRLAAYQKAVRQAVSPARLEAVLRKLAAQAEDGDVVAAKVLLDRTLGKVTAARDGDAAAVELPTLATTADTVAASNAILQALGEGRLSPDAAAKYATIVELARRTLETHDLAQRLAALEREREADQ